MNKAIFLDRDGVINEDPGYVSKIQDYRFMPRVFEALRMAQSSGYKLVIVTNQAGIGKRVYSEDDYHMLTSWIKQRFQENNIEISQIYHCPHHPEAVIEKFKQKCGCRKPNPGMLLLAAQEHDLDLSNSYMIGDRTSDVLAGKRAGCKTILVKTGYGGSDQEHQVNPDHVVEDLYEAVGLILNNNSG